MVQGYMTTDWTETRLRRTEVCELERYLGGTISKTKRWLGQSVEFLLTGRFCCCCYFKKGDSWRKSYKTLADGKDLIERKRLTLRKKRRG